MNSNQLLRILQQDAFTKTVFTDVLPSESESESESHLFHTYLD